MKVILKTREGYIKSENIKICKKEDATVFASIRDALQECERIHAIKPMIGKIEIELIR